MNKIKILFLLYFLVLNNYIIHSQEAQSDIKSYEKKIFFIIEDSKNLYQICVMDLNGKNKRVLTNKGNNWCPAISPDGEKIAFYSDRSNFVNLWIMNTDGAQQIQLTLNNENINTIDLKNTGQISWNTDNKEIYFLKNNNICKIDKNGNSPTNITKTNDITSFKLSPDGKKWLFSREKTKYHNSLWTMNYNTSGLIQITESNIFNPVFDWGDKNQIIFLHNRGISLVNYDGTNYRIISNIINLDNNLTWSKYNNNYVAYINNDYNIWIMNIDGKNQKQITTNSGFSPYWVDNQTLLYIENNDIYIINIDNMKKQRLTYYLKTYYPIAAEIIKKNNIIKDENINNE